jgi:hypothetical protein
MKTGLATFGLWIFLGLLSAACAGLNERVLDSKTETLRARSIQTRVIDTSDRERALRDVIATLTDLGFWVEKADATLGVVKASKSSLIMTVAVSPRGSGQVVVRANAQQQMSPVEDPEAYQRFFAALEKAMFLTAHQVD